MINGHRTSYMSELLSINMDFNLDVRRAIFLPYRIISYPGMLTMCLSVVGACVVVTLVVLDHHRHQWSSSYPDHSYSFFVACAGAGAYVLAALMAFMEICTGSS